jgi:2-polyprenyl-3-methyl-5-hydroxy-6-metoxy-1,4-benzoquinol methylase
MHQCPLCTNATRKEYYSGKYRRYFECSYCGLIALDQQQLPTMEEAVARYRHHQNSSDNAGYRNHLNTLVVPLLRLLKAGVNGLDFGCGPSPVLSQILAQNGYQVDNYDPVFYPKELVSEVTYDFITCTEVIEHFFKPHEQFTKLIKLLNVGGCLAVMTEVYDETIDFASWWYVRDITHVSIYQSKTFDWIAKEFQLAVQRPHKNVYFLTR